MSLKISNKKPSDQLASFQRLFREAADHPVRQQWFKNSNLAYQYRQGQMWTPEELKVLEARKQAPVVINLIEADRRRFEGQYKRQKLAVSFVGRNEPTDEEEANALGDLIKFIDQDTEYSFEETEAVNDLYISGFGVLEVGAENGPAGGYRLFTRAEDPYAIFPDPFCRRYDWNDKRGGARYIIRSKWLHIDDAKDRLPKHAKKLDAALEQSPSGMIHTMSTTDPEVLRNHLSHYYDSVKRMVRLVEVWWKERTSKEVICLKDGSKIEQYDKDEAKRVLKFMKGSYFDTQDVDQLYVAVFAGDIMISPAEEAPYKTNLFPFIPFYGFRKKDGEPYGHVASLIDPNREVNARRSKALYMMNHRLTVFEKNAVRDKDELAENMALADGMIELQDGGKEKFEIVENVDISQGNLQMLQASKEEFKALSGEDYLQPSSEIRSGTGIAQAQLPYHLSQVGVFENIRRSKHMRARLLVDLIKQYYDDDMVFQITDDQDKVRTVELTRGTLESIKSKTFDLVLKDVTEYATMQQEQYATLQTTLPQIAQHGPAWAKILVSTSEIKNKKEILDQLDAMSKTPPTPPKPSITIKWEELDSTERAAFAMQMGLPELAEYEQKQQKKTAQSERLEADLHKTMIREGAKSGRDASKAEQDAAGKMGDMALHSREIGVKEAQLEQDQQALEQDADLQQQALDQSAAESAEPQGDE